MSIHPHGNVPDILRYEIPLFQGSTAQREATNTIYRVMQLGYGGPPPPPHTHLPKRVMVPIYDGEALYHRGKWDAASNYCPARGNMPGLGILP